MRMSDVDSLSQGVVVSMSHGVINSLQFRQHSPLKRKIPEKNVFNNPSIDSLPEMYFNFEKL